MPVDEKTVALRCQIFCCCCKQDVPARLTDGIEIYPHRTDLFRHPFWICDACGNFVGCHWRSTAPTKPLGVIATPAIKHVRKRIHRILDPLWDSGAPPIRKKKRRKVYAALSALIGYEYHTANIRSVEEGQRIYNLVEGMKNAPGI